MRPKSAFGVPKTVSDPGGRNGARNREVLRVNNLFCQCARLHHPRHLIRALQRKKRGDATGVSRCEPKDSIFESSDLCTPLRARGMRTSPQLQRCHDGAGDAHPPGEHCYGRERDADRDAKRHIGSTAESDSNLERGQRNMFAVNPRPAIGRFDEGAGLRRLSIGGNSSAVGRSAKRPVMAVNGLTTLQSRPQVSIPVCAGCATPHTHRTSRSSPTPWSEPL